MEQVATPTVTAPVAPSAQESSQAPQSNTPSSKPVAADPQKPEYWEVVVNGATKRYTKEEALSKITLGEGAHEKFQEAAKIKAEKAAEDADLAKDFIRVLERRGLSKDQIRSRMEQWYHENFIEPETLTADQRKIKEQERRLQEFESEKTRQEEEHKTRAQQQLEAYETQKVQQEIIKIIDDNKLPKTWESVKKVAQWMRYNQKNNFNAPNEVIVNQINEADRNYVQTQFANAEPEYIVNMLGEQIVNKIRKWDLARLQQKFNQPVSQSRPKSSAKGPVRMSDVDGYFKSLRQTKG